MLRFKITLDLSSKVARSDEERSEWFR